MTKKLEKQLEEYYSEIERLIPDPKEQKRALHGLKNNIRSYLKEKPDANFNEITSRYGKPDEISEYYMPQSQGEEPSPGLSVDIRKLIPMVGSVALVVVIVVLAVINRPVQVIPTGGPVENQPSSDAQSSLSSQPLVSEPALVESSNPDQGSQPEKSEEEPQEGVSEPEELDGDESSNTEEEPEEQGGEESDGEITGTPDTQAPREYIVAESSTRLLTADDLEGLTNEELMLARNEIYARRGRRFNDPQLQSYFDSQPWYTGTIAPSSFNDASMTEVESRNIDFITSFEQS